MSRVQKLYRDVALIALMVAALFIAGCTSIGTAETRQQRLFAVQGEFNLALAAAGTYTNRPPCGEVRVSCHDPSVKKKIIDMALAAKDALDIAKSGGAPEIAAVLVRRLTSYLLEKGLIK